MTTAARSHPSCQPVAGASVGVTVVALVSGFVSGFASGFVSGFVSGFASQRWREGKGGAQAVDQVWRSVGLKSASLALVDPQ